MNKAMRALPRLILGVVLTALPWCGLAAQEIPQWRVQVGDDLSWAAPDFDDSAWQTESWPQLGGAPDLAGIRWYRATLNLDPAFMGQDLAIALPPLFEAYEVYVNGTRVGSHGSWLDRDRAPFPRSHVFRISFTPKLRIAIRRWSGATISSYASLVETGILAHVHPPSIGLTSILTLAEENHTLQTQLDWTPNLMGRLLLLFAGFLSIAVYFSQKSRLDNLWLGLTLLAGSASHFLGSATAFWGEGLRSEWSVLSTGLLSFVYVSEALWLRAICPRFRPFLAWAALFHGIYAVSRLISFYFQFPLLESSSTISSLTRMLIVCVAAAGLIMQRRSWPSILLTTAAFVSASAQYWRISGTASSGYLRLWGMYIDNRVSANLLFAGLALVGLYLKHLEAQKKKEILDRDLGAARMVQESLLVAEGSLEWVVDAVYLPASEVGGDFHHTTLARDGSLLVVTGDLGGKGLPASLLVAAVVGALGDLVSRQPAEVLAHLNRSLLGKTRGGFVTCACALFHADGVVYQEKQASGKPFVFVSDGVVEAANAEGELLGFERSRDLSTKSAYKFAEEARTWGQNDDITVVTVRRQA